MTALAAALQFYCTRLWGSLFAVLDQSAPRHWHACAHVEHFLRVSWHQWASSTRLRTAFQAADGVGASWQVDIIILYSPYMCQHAATGRAL
jgi:hypothetical protein